MKIPTGRSWTRAEQDEFTAEAKAVAGDWNGLTPEQERAIDLEDEDNAYWDRLQRRLEDDLNA